MFTTVDNCDVSSRTWPRLRGVPRTKSSGLACIGLDDRVLDKSSMFTTDGRDNDRSGMDNCASIRDGGWWFNNCFSVCLTCGSIYHEWNSLPTQILIHSRMMIKPPPD